MTPLSIIIIIAALMAANVAASLLLLKHLCKNHDGNQETDLPQVPGMILTDDNVIAGAIRRHTGQTTGKYINGQYYIGKEGKPAVLAIKDASDMGDGGTYYANNLDVDARMFAQAVQGNAGTYKFYKDELTGQWLFGQGSPVDPASFGISNYNITYKPGGFTVTFEPEVPARWEQIN